MIQIAEGGNRDGTSQKVKDRNGKVVLPLPSRLKKQKCLFYLRALRKVIATQFYVQISGITESFQIMKTI